MTTNIKGTNLDLSPEIKDYIFKKIATIEKLFSEEELEAATALFEVARRGGQKSGGVFKADCLITLYGERFYASSEGKEDLHQAIDEVRESLFREIRRSKNKKWALFYKGARKMKEMMKSARSYRPWRK